ncbi:MobQ family relaxase [Clostridium sp. WILCCON 0269]|uniref:MobQ family relaxase n=1 Tax=Candidatus Clostridium eludens TaxID=3381663 RepID=A0ABW8SPR2_9CLOT
MAIFHFEGQIITRSDKKGRQRSSVACAAYRSAEKLLDERNQAVKYYKRQIPPVTRILVPDNAPKWASDRQRLWNEVEKKEKQHNAQLAREFNVALPKELSSEEQEELAFEFCKKTFVDNGMVADISIHREDENNPHFHVMLTMRPFNDSGEWGNKQRKEKVITESGKVKYRAVHITDWNDRNKMKEWRKAWEVMTNSYLEKNGINERISCKSNKELGKETKPQIHEGYAARNIVKRGGESYRVNHNKDVKEYNRNVIELNEYKREKERSADNNKFYNCLDEKEVKKLSNISKYIKAYVNIENIEYRKRQLNNWSKSLEFKDDTIEKIRALSRIEKEEEMLSTAEKILENNADRFIQKHYKNLDLDSLNKHEKIYLVDTTLRENKLLNEEEIEQVKNSAENDRLENSLKDILNNRARFSISLEHDIEHLKDIFNEVEEKYNISFDDIDTVRNAPKKVLTTLRKIANTRKELKVALEIMNKVYDNRLEKMYPNWDNKTKLTIQEKEILIMSNEYYGKTVRAEDFKNPPRKYNLSEQKEILNLLNKDRELLKQKYTNFRLNSKSFVYMFHAECASYYDELGEKQKEQVNNYFNKDNYLKDFKVFNNEFSNNFFNEHLSYERKFDTPKINNLLSDTLKIFISEVNKRIDEEELKRNKKLKQQRRRGHGRSL